jgi:hypothetical protein
MANRNERNGEPTCKIEKEFWDQVELQLGGNTVVEYAADVPT